MSGNGVDMYVQSLLNFCFAFQVLVQIADRGVSSNVAAQTATVQVNVFRNQNTPVFISTPYATTVQENTGVGQSIFRVTATDADQPVSDFFSVVFQIQCISR